MRGNEFLDKLEFIDPAYVEEADEQPRRKRAAWLKWGGLAACVCVVAAAALTLPQQGRHNLPPDPAPFVTIPASDGPVVDHPQEPTSDTYSSLEELLDYLRLHDGHTQSQSDAANLGYSAAHAVMEGADTVRFQGTVYQLSYDGEHRVGIYRDGVLTGTLDALADYLFLSDGRLVAVGTELFSGTELDPVYCVRVNVFDLTDPARPKPLDRFTQIGSLTACWLSGGQLYLMTDDGVCACGWSRLDSIDDYKPQLFHGEEQLPWLEEDISILGEPSRVSYTAVSRIDMETLKVAGQHAYYGDIEDVFYGEDWFALVTSTTLDNRQTLPDVYTFGGSLAFTGKCDLAQVFGLEKTQTWSEGQEPPRSAQRPVVKAVSRSGDVWRIVGESTHTAGPTWWRELFAVTFDPQAGETAKQTLQLPEDQFSIDDVLWEDSRAIISAGYVHFGSGVDDVDRGTRLVFAEFDGMAVSLLSSDLICGRVQGVDGIYWYGSPLGCLKPFIPLGDGLYLRYNSTPDGFDLFDLSDSANPACLYQSQGDIPEGCRLDFASCVLSKRTVAVQLITPGEDEGYRDAVTTWAIFAIDPDSDTPILMREKLFPLAGTDPAALAFTPSDLC